MALKNNLLLYGFLFIVILESTAAIASKTQIVEYSNLGFILWIVYLTLGYLITKQYDLKKGVMSAVMLGTFDVLIGWIILKALNINDEPPTTQQANFLMYFFAGFAGVLYATFFGSIGSAIAYYRFKRNDMKSAPHNHYSKLR